MRERNEDNATGRVGTPCSFRGWLIDHLSRSTIYHFDYLIHQALRADLGFIVGTQSLLLYVFTGAGCGDCGWRRAGRRHAVLGMGLDAELQRGPEEFRASVHGNREVRASSASETLDERLVWEFFYGGRGECGEQKARWAR